MADARIAARRARLTERMRTRRAQLAKDSTPGTTISPEYLSRCIGETVGKDAVSSTNIRCGRTIAARKARHVLRAGSRGRTWMGFGAALGAKLAAPDKFVVATLGDGAYMFANPMVGHWVSAVQNLPILTILFNNSRYGAVRHATMSMFKDGVAGENDGRTLADLDPRRRSRRWRARKAPMPSAWKNLPTCPRPFRARAMPSSRKSGRRCSTSLPPIERIISRKFEVTEKEYMRIDAYTHFIPEKYFNKIVESGHADIGKRVREIPCIHDLDVRRKIVDGFKDYAQIFPIRCRRWRS